MEKIYILGQNFLKGAFEGAFRGGRLVPITTTVNSSDSSDQDMSNKHGANCMPKSSLPSNCVELFIISNRLDYVVSDTEWPSVIHKKKYNKELKTVTATMNLVHV